MRRVFSVIYMFSITLAFTSLVSGVKLATDERIRINEKVKLQRIILKVMDFPEAETSTDAEVSRIFEDRIKAIKLNGNILYEGFEEDGQTLRGYAFPVGGPGFWGPIYGMAGVDPHADRLLNIDFYEHSETPGLGGRMTEAWFRNQFRGLSLSPKEAGSKIFYLKAPGTSKGPNELDAITGATGTTKGIEAFLNRDLERFREKTWPELQKQEDRIHAKTS